MSNNIAPAPQPSASVFGVAQAKINAKRLHPKLSTAKAASSSSYFRPRQNRSTSRTKQAPTKGNPAAGNKHSAAIAEDRPR